MKKYIPSNKSDEQALEHLKNCSFDEVKGDVAKLLEWMQDLHWGFGQGIGAFLSPHVNEIKSELLYILNSDDNEWKRGILKCVIEDSPKRLDPELITVLKRISEHPTKGEIEEDVVEVAAEILAINDTLPL